MEHRAVLPSAQSRRERRRELDLAGFERRWNEGLGVESWEVAAFFGLVERSVRQLLHAHVPVATQGRRRFYSPAQVRVSLGQATKPAPAAGGVA